MSTLNDCHSIDDLRRVAQRRLPRAVFEYIDRGCDDDVALAENRSAINRIKLVPRLPRNVSGRSSSTTLFGHRIELPVVIAPTGSAGLTWYKGEIELARAAAAAGVPFTLATGTMSTIEEIARAVSGRFWFQLYLWPDRQLSYDLVRRALAADYEALVVTVDTPVRPWREADRRNHFYIPFRPTVRNVVDMLGRPRWLAGTMLRYLVQDGMPRLAHHPRPTSSIDAARVGPAADVDLDDVRRLRDLWPRKLLVKGILSPDDANDAVDAGADGIIVSNHGGRNLDSAIASFDALPAICAAVGGRATIIVDSGVRRGSDILKAVALGASAVQIGRATLYGTAAGGQQGAAKALSLLRTQLDIAMANVGCSSIEHANISLVTS